MKYFFKQLSISLIVSIFFAAQCLASEFRAVSSVSGLDQIVQNVTRKTNTDTDEFEELDLSEFSSIDEQIEFLKSQDRIDTMYVT